MSNLFFLTEKGARCSLRGKFNRPFSAASVAFLLWAQGAAVESAWAQNAYLNHKLVSDIPGNADVTDTNLVNPWGIAFSATSPFWISDNHAGVSTLYNSSGTPQSLIVTIPPPAGGAPPAAPTGVIFNSSTGFVVVSNAAARFIFATEDGTISGWNSGTSAVLKVDNSASGTVYKGLAFAQSGGSNYIYATDFHNGKVDVFDSNYNPATLAGSFADPSIPSGFAPFGIEPVKGQLYVTYALQNAAKHDDVSGTGNGFVNVFDTSGNLVKRLISHGVLNSPWGLALAPTGFGPFSGTLLVGNFGDGHINAFDPNTGTALGILNDSTGAAFTVDGLWGIKFGNGGSGGDAHTLYYTAGIPGTGVVEDHGLFGSLTPVFPTFLSDTDQGLAVALTWAGGAAPYLLQKKADLSAPSWVDVLTTSNRSAMVAKDGGEGLFRLVNPAPNVVLSFTVLMNGASEVPPTTATASGMGTLSLEGSNLTYNISFSGLTGPATAGHIHAPATATNSASVIIPFSVPAATAGTIAGTVALTADQITNIIGGLAYANIHTASNPGGEIRGQVVPLHMVVPLNGASEVSAVTTTATGTASLTFIGSQMFYTVSYSGLSGAATASHIHGPAATTNNASVIIPFNTPSGTSGSISGSVTLTPTQLTWLLSGQTYVNVHTTTNPGGEIRGQVYPFTFGATMNGASEVGPTTSPGTGQASLTLVNGVLSWGINFTNLTAPATAAHIHGPADTTHNASVIIPFSAPAATSGVISGSAALTSAQLFDIVSGLSYANIHTSTNPGGEIRGQVLPNN